MPMLKRQSVHGYKYNRYTHLFASKLEALCIFFLAIFTIEFSFGKNRSPRTLTIYISLLRFIVKKAKKKKEGKTKKAIKKFCNVLFC